jgi:hypothetical protein
MRRELGTLLKISSHELPSRITELLHKCCTDTRGETKGDVPNGVICGRTIRANLSAHD